MSDATEIPQGEPAPPVDASPAPDPAQELYSRLQNLDTRAETLEQTLIPGQDLPPGMTWQEARQALFSMQQAEPEPEPDPWDQFQEPQPQFLGYDEQGQPVFANQQPPAFDPSMIREALGHEKEAWMREAVQTFQQQQAQFVQDQNLVVGVSSAAQEHNLSDFAKRVVEMQARELVRQQPNRAPAEIAREVAAAYVADQNARFVAQGGAPAPSGSVPSGPIPADQKPKSIAELNEFWRTQVSPSV